MTQAHQCPPSWDNEATSTVLSQPACWRLKLSRNAVQLGPAVGAQVEVREQPLSGISAELKSGKRDSISILVGDRSEDHVTHIIDAPSHVRLKETEEGAHEALQIDSAGGVTTLLRFRSTVRSELLDGYVSR